MMRLSAKVANTKTPAPRCSSDASGPVLTGQQQPQGELDENAWIGILERWSEGRKGCDLHKERRAFTSRCPMASARRPGAGPHHAPGPQYGNGRETLGRLRATRRNVF